LDRYLPVCRARPLLGKGVCFTFVLIVRRVGAQLCLEQTRCRLIAELMF
jgi:hypothetical protein